MYKYSLQPLIFFLVVVCRFFSFIIPFFCANVLIVPSCSICFSFAWTFKATFVFLPCNLHRETSSEHTKHLGNLRPQFEFVRFHQSTHDHNEQLAEFKVPPLCTLLQLFFCAYESHYTFAYSNSRREYFKFINHFSRDCKQCWGFHSTLIRNADEEEFGNRRGCLLTVQKPTECDVNMCLAKVKCKRT